ncbi:hypothetical protein L7F22_013403 [Adiantum nelumboides]|nr:hypothetical protein [Adiantum nelumboides]
MNKLMRLNMKKGSSVSSHLNEFNALYSQLTSKGLNFDDKMKAIFLLCSLRASWDTFNIANSNSTHGGKLAFGDVTSVLLTEEIRCQFLDSGGHGDPSDILIFTTDIPYDALLALDDCYAQTWIIDLGASFHVTPHREWFATYSPMHYSVKLGDSHQLEIFGIGDVKICMANGTQFMLKDVRHVPKLSKSLVSIGQLDDLGYSTMFGNGSWLIRKANLGATNSVAHMMNGMNKVLRDFIPQTTMPFLDDVPIKGCDTKEKDEALDLRGCRKFVANHIDDCDKILSRLEDVNLTLSGQKSIFGVNEVLIVGHMCGTYGRRPCPTKIDAIQRMKETWTSITEVSRFLGADVFYLIWIPHYAHVADPLYQLLRKNQTFEWKDAHTQAMRKLKKLLLSLPTIRKVDYECGRPMIVTLDTSPTGIGWAVGQDDEEQRRYVVRFGAKVLNARQRNYPQVKKELWGVVTALKCDREYFIEASVIVEIDYLPLLGMITSCSTPDIAMLRWI